MFYFAHKQDDPACTMDSFVAVLGRRQCFWLSQKAQSLSITSKQSSPSILRRVIPAILEWESKQCCPCVTDHSQAATVVV